MAAALEVGHSPARATWRIWSRHLLCFVLPLTTLAFGLTAPHPWWGALAFFAVLVASVLVDNRAAARAHTRIENVDAHMPAMQKGVAGAQHEDDGVLPDVKLLHPNEADGEDVAQHDDKEADRDRAEGQPRHDAPDDLVQAVDGADEGDRCVHPSLDPPEAEP